MYILIPLYKKPFHLSIDLSPLYCFRLMSHKTLSYSSSVVNPSFSSASLKFLVQTQSAILSEILIDNPKSFHYYMKKALGSSQHQWCGKSTY